MELPSGSDPADRSVRANDSKFRCVRFPVSSSISDGLLDKFPVFRVYRSAKVLSLCGIAVRFDSEYRLQIAEPTIDPSLGIPLPSHRFPSLHCETHPVITDYQRSFCCSSSRALPQQPDNQQRFQHDQSNAASHEPLVRFPHCWLPVEDDAAWGKIGFLESPALQGSPIEHVDIAAPHDRYVLRL